MHSIMRFTLTRVVVLVSLLFASGCGRDQPAQGAAPPGGMPPAGVKLLTLEQKPLEQSSEFIATVRSLRSTTVQPDVEGLVTKILVKSGDRVRAGAPLVQINADKQQAAVLSTEANRAGTEADVQYWRQQVKRLEALVEAGAISRQEFDQAQNQLRTTEARLAALQAQVSEQQVELRYYRVAAPQDGVVGEIPIRQGDRVTTSTVITTIDANDALEAYIEVPIERAPGLRVGLPVRLLDVDGKVAATNPITFVAPRVEPGTQSVLAKVALKDTPERMRTQQFIKARIVWSTAPGVTVPVVAVTRISGQYFCFVAEPQGQGLVARQRPLKVGEVLGDDYVVVSGVKPGEKVIVSGIQKIGDGAPVQPEDSSTQKPAAGTEKPGAK
jgi:RND family efflux transporter MFP subunit